MINKINKNKRKIRNQGIDLIIIVSIYAILLGNLFKKYNKYKELVIMNISCFFAS